MIIINAFIEKKKLLSGAQAREKLYQNYSMTDFERYESLTVSENSSR